MSSLTIQQNNIESYQIKFDNLLKYFANKSWLYEHYRVGGEENPIKIAHALLLSRVMCSNDCSVINFINDKINGKIDKSCHKKPLSDKVKEYKKECGYNPTDSEIINACCNTSDIKASQW